jgi:hypothetical protein
MACLQTLSTVVAQNDPLRAASACAARSCEIRLVAVPATGRNGAWPKSRRNCLCRKELEKVSGLPRRQKEFRPPQKKFSAKIAKEGYSRQVAKEKTTKDTMDTKYFLRDLRALRV